MTTEIVERVKHGMITASWEPLEGDKRIARLWEQWLKELEDRQTDWAKVIFMSEAEACEAEE